MDRKSTLEDYLVSRHGFTSIHLESANHYVCTRKFTFIFFSLSRPSRSMSVLPETFCPSGPLSVAERGKCKSHTFVFDCIIPPNGKSRGGGGEIPALTFSVRFRYNLEMIMDKGPDPNRHGKQISHTATTPGISPHSAVAPRST